MFLWVTRVLQNYRVCGGWFSVCAEGYVVMVLADCDVQEIDTVIRFFLYGEFHCGQNVVELFE